MADSAAQLKRKRESVGPQQKKSKKQRASAEDGGDVSVATTPVPQATSKSPAGSKSDTPKSSAQARRQSISQPNGIVVEKDATANTPSKPNRKAQKQEKKDLKSENNSDVKELVKALTAESGTLQSTGQAKSKKQKNKGPASWSMSPAQGGWFLPVDPIFSTDERFLILANLKSLQIYSTETSLLASVLHVGGAGVVTAYALSPTEPNYVYVADSNGLITLWNWKDGVKIGRWDIGATVRNMAVIIQPGSDEDLVYCHETGNSHIINVHALRTKSQASKTELKRVLKATSSIQSIQVLLQGKYVIATTSDTITVGKRLKASKTAVQEFEYAWRELKFSKRITTCNTYFREHEPVEKGKKSPQDQRDVLDLAVGDETGVVLLFEDILASFAALENSQKGNKSKLDNAESLRPKRFHWHRDAVGAVKWSLDGNYLISGGDETVLTLWQLATGKPQHLPHLTAAIENVVVSPTGSSYALTLANNSIIILSTTELEAKSNIVGIQSRRVDQEQLPKESNSGKPSYKVFQSVPMAMDPKSGKEVILSVPSSQPRQRHEGLRPEPYLQSFDIANYRPVNRQALTRNNATDPNMGPEGRRIVEPSVKLLQVSHDGEWLATVDEWVPPRPDTNYLNEGINEINEEERFLRREVYLKFWRRDEKSGQWALEARVDAPHFFEDVCGQGRVFDLVADPSEHGFATVGEDQTVRIWRPKTRTRDGIVVRGAGEKGLVNWSMDRSIELPEPSKVWTSETSAIAQQTWLRTSRLAFSADGSTLAAAVSGTSDTDSGVVHLIDAFGATIKRSMIEFNVAALCGLGIVGRHLIVIAEAILVWDLVNDDLAYSIPINTTGIDRFDRIPLVRLAINQDDSTFAISLPHFERNESSTSRLKKATSKISVYSTEKQDALWSHTVPGITLGLVARKGERGYIALDSVSCIRTISPTTHSLRLPTPAAEDKMEVQRITDADEDEELGDAEESRFEIMALDSDYERPVITQQDLEGIFHKDVLPPPKDLFRAVLGLFGGLSQKAA